MRIIIVTEVFLPKIDGIVTRVTGTLEELARQGHDVMVLAPGDAPATYAGFPVRRTRSLPLAPIYPEIKFGLPTRRDWMAIDRFRPDVIHAVGPVWLAAFAAEYAHRHSIPLLASYHTNIPAYTTALGIGAIRGFTVRWLRRHHNLAQVNLVTSPQMVPVLEELGVRNIAVWPKSVDTRRYHPRYADPATRSALTGGHPELPLLLTVGRISKEKNLQRLPGIMDQLPEARLAVVGEGPYRDELAGLLDRRRTVFTGYLTGEDLSRAFASSDAFLFPSLTETLGLVALEAAASGLPVAASRAGGIPAIIRDRVAGILLDPHATDREWADAVRELLAERDRYSREARREAEASSWEDSTRTLVEAYQLAIDRFEENR